jgi:hypothetical protein
MFACERPKLRNIHTVSSILAIILISTFLITTLIAELSGIVPFITTVKQGIAFGLLILVPTMATIGLSGARLAGTTTYPVIQQKRRSMIFIAANGLLVLMPCALILAWLATTDRFGVIFYVVQGIELIAGSINITLLVRNAWIGKSMNRKTRQQCNEAIR